MMYIIMLYALPFSQQVLLLTMDDESSSGVNLTTANHAIFVHPLLAVAQQQYDAYETQVSFAP